MTCPHNFQAWNHATLADLATEQYLQIQTLKALVAEYRKALALSPSDAGDAGLSTKPTTGADARRDAE